MLYTRNSVGREIDLQDFIAERALLLGAGSTVLNQLAIKGVGLGVAEHSTTLQRPADRLRTTLTYVYVMVLGTDEERRLIARLVNRAHAQVRSPGRYSAFDPDLQLWVAATLAYNGMFIYERTFGPLSPQGRERIYEQSKVFGNALQVTDEMWPDTLADFDAYWQESLGRMESDPTVRAYVASLLDRRNQPLRFQLQVPLQPHDSRQRRPVRACRPRPPLDAPRPASLRGLLEGLSAAVPRSTPSAPTTERPPCPARHAAALSPRSPRDVTTALAS